MKFIKRLIITLLLIIICVTGGIIYTGHSMYKEAINNKSISERINEIRKDKNYVPIGEMSEDFKHAIVAVEDHRFYSHNGIDIITTTRSMLENIREKYIVSGRKHNYTTIR